MGWFPGEDVQEIKGALHHMCEHECTPGTDKVRSSLENEVGSHYNQRYLQPH